MSHILVTGSEGLIGQRLCTSLTNLGWTVHRFDHKLAPDHQSFGDILDLKQLQLRLANCVGIVHLAAVSRVVWGQRDPEQCWQTNVVGTQNVIAAARSAPLQPWILYASSREVYGQQPRLPVAIEAPYLPMNIYARSKVAAEQAILQARTPSLRTAVVRYSSVYGSRADHVDRVVPAFCRAAVLGTPLRIEGAANKLDFTHVDDTVRGTIALIKELARGNAKLPPVHLTTGTPTTLAELANLACSAAGQEAIFLTAASRSYDVAQFWGDPTQVTRILGWQAQIPLAVGITNLVREFQASLRAPL